MSERENEYIIEGASIANLSYADILKHSTAVIETDKRPIASQIHPDSLQIDLGVFTNPSSSLGALTVSVAQVGDSVVLSCPCNAPKKTLCEHQVKILRQIIDRPQLRIFFDPKLRQAKLREFAKDYGMENEPNLKDFFELEYINKALEIRPRVKELLAINPTLKEDLLPKDGGILDKLPDESPTKKAIVVLRKHRYYEQFTVELYEAETAMDGSIKNPLVLLDPLNLVWKTEEVSEAKFYTGIAKFQNVHETSTPQSDIEGLRAIVNNPLGLEVYYHDKEASENITAASIVPVKVKILRPDIRLHVFKKEPFYEVSGELVLNSKKYPFDQLKIRYDYFILLANTLHLIADTDMLKVVKFFQSNNQKVLVHASKYGEFKRDILEQLEEYISIDYSYIKSATKKQLEERELNMVKEKLIYLSGNDSYVSITPVVKYGNVEVPVISRKKIHDIDQNRNVFEVKRDDNLEEQLTSIIARQHPFFREQLEEGQYFYLHLDRFLDEEWFLDVFEEWRSQDITILGFNDLKKNRLSSYKAKVSVDVKSGMDWFNTALSVNYGPKKVTMKELHRSIGNKSRYVKLDDGTLGIIPQEWMEKFAEYFSIGEVVGELLKIPKSNFYEINRLFETEVLDKEVQRELEEYQQKFADFEGIKSIPVPKELKTTLRDYQHQGLNWLNFLDDFNFGACLADDMGLGKTVQIIAFILSQRKKQKNNTNLVVVPTSLLFNWQEEVAKFAPGIKLFTNYGTERIRDSKGFGQYEIVLTTYGMLLSDVHFLKNFSFNYIFLDESQAIKNPESQRYKAARLLQSRNKVVLTGTPIENNTFDIYGQLSFACPGLLGSKKNFKDIYSTPIDTFENSKRAKELQKKIEPFILRRTKREVAKELPDKTEMVIYCEMGEDQRKVYNNYEKELRDYLNAKKNDEIKQDSMYILTGLTKLRQICNSPALVKDEEFLGEFSAKIEVLIEQIENKSSQHKILVFSQFVGMLDLIRKELKNRDVNFEYLTGQTKNRAQKVKSFQEDNEVRVFLISLKAGGTGLNLTEADYVYLVDPWWNPAVENQAIDRCYRIGQKKNVIAVRLICPDTVEEKIMKLQESKTQLADDLIKTDGDIFKSLSKEDLLGMLS